MNLYNFLYAILSDYILYLSLYHINIDVMSINDFRSLFIYAQYK